MKNLSKRAKEIIGQIKYATIASVSENGLPWNAPVFTAFDEQYNFYFGTHKDSQKAKNIRANGRVFLVIYDSTVPVGTGEAVYIKASAQEVSDPSELRRIFELLKERRKATYWGFAALDANGPIRLYKATPEQAWMNDAGSKNGHYIDTRTKIRLRD